MTSQVFFQHFMGPARDAISFINTLGLNTPTA
jgi:hypothetical protein